MLKTARLTAAAALLMLALAGCSSDSTNDNTKATDNAQGGSPIKVSIAIQPWLGYGAWYIAQDQGYFAENNLEVDLIDFEADADMLAALAAGKVDGLNVASHGALLMAEQGVEAKIVLLLDASTSADAILTDGSITSVAGLKGQQVAYEEGATSDLLLNYALLEAGMTIDDVTKVPLGAADAGNALMAGRVPAAVTYEPYITEAMSQGNGVQVLYEAGVKEGLISDVLMVSDAFIAENPEAVTALIKSWGQALDFYNANPEAGRAIIADGVGENPEDLTTAFDGVEFFDLNANTQLLTGDYLQLIMPAVQEAAVKAGLLDGSVEPATIIDASFLP
ncbi:MAG: aliphatic sulfonate ABC transporter substrate-binding protein [Micrococcales bacterium]|nr:aliphatic sulfonate ABC transporter substrate-binding protein [Micrococcales bacterium]